MTVSLATPTLSLTPASDTGVSHTDGVTDDAVPVFYGTATPGALVTLTDATSGLSVQARADRYGNYVAMFAGLDAGAHALTASSTDAAGNMSPTSNPCDIDIETAATATSTAPLVSETADSVNFSVHFDQPVSAVTAASFMLVATGDAYGNVETVTGSGEDYTVTVAGLGGTGNVGLAFSDDAPTDVAGNQIALASGLHEVADTAAGATTLVSADATGAQHSGAAPAVSGGGRVVAFISSDGTLVPGGQTTPGVGNLYVKDLQTGTVVQVTNGDEQVEDVQISADGSTVAFSSVTPDGAVDDGAAVHLNLYVAKLTSALGVGGLSLVPGSTRLVGQLNDAVALLDEGVGFALSGDGSTLAYQGNSTAPDGTTGVDTDYLENLATGTQTQFATDGAIASISLDGTRVAYTAFVDVPGTGGEPNPIEGGTYPPNVIQDAFVYDAATGKSVTIDGSGLLPGTDPPLGPGEDPDYLTAYPVLSGDGSTVVFQLQRAAGQSSLFSVNLANPSAFSPVSPGASSDGGTDDDFDQSVSQGGGVIAYESLDPTLGYHAEIYTPAMHTTTDLGGALEPVLDTQGNAVVYTAPVDPSDPTSEDVVYETTLGVSASIGTIDGDDAIDAAELKLAAKSGLAASGTTNAPAGSSVLLYVLSAVPGAVRSASFNGVVGEDGTWTATIPAAVAATLTDGTYALFVQILDAAGASAKTSRLFTVDDVAPAQPVIPHLDPGSAAGLGQNGTPVTNTATPTIDGVTDPLSLVSLYADVAGGTPAAVASARADQNGVYSITAPHLADGIQDLEVQAVDPAGNPSPFSSSLEIIVDTTPPDPPPTPTLLYYSESPDGPVTNDPVLHVIGTAEPNSDVTLVDAITGDVLAADVVVGEDGTYAAATHELADGKYSVAAYATDQAGNVGKLSEYGVDVTVDTMAPDAPTIESVSGGTASDGSLSPSLDISGEAEPFSQVALLVDGAPDTIDPAVTADEDGEFDLQTAGLPAGTHTLTVTATDFAGNVSNASAPMTVTISDTPVPPLGAPPDTATLDGIVIDGPISGATVFADTNRNGMRDADEGSTVTGTDGRFMLADTGGELVATGGVDVTTGLRPTLTLTAPAGSNSIDPLTTLLDAFAALTGADPRSVQAQLVAALGLPAGTDLTTLDPSAALLAGDGLPAVLAAKIMDTLTDFQAYLAGNGITESDGFAAGFTAIAHAVARTIASLPAGQTLDLDDGSSLEAIFEDAAGPSAGPLDTPIGGNSNAVITVAAFGNEALTADLQTGGSGLAAAVAATETVYQGAAATALAGVGLSAAAGAQVVNLYDTSEPLDDALANDAGLTSGPPSLAVDTGRSDADDVIDVEPPTFVGSALPGTEVALFVAGQPDGSSVPGRVLGVGVADALGRYSITSVPIDASSTGENFAAAEPAPYQFGVAGSAPTQDITFTVGETLELPNTTPLLDVTVDPMAPAQPMITDATVAAAPGDDSDHTALYVYGSVAIVQNPLDDEGGTISVYADGDPTPVATSSTGFNYGNPDGTSSSFFFGLTTTPLSDGPHVLTVSETLAGGTIVQGATSYAVTVASPSIVDGAATASGSLEGARVYDAAETLQPYTVESAIFGSRLVPTLVQTIDPVDTVEALSDGTGAYQIAEPTADASDLLVATGGRDTLTGLPLGGALAQIDPSAAASYGNLDTDAGSLLAPIGSTAISPLTSIEALLLQTKGGAAGAATLAGFGLQSGLDLGTLDPVAEAQAGDVRPFLVAAELLDTVTMLAPFIGFDFAPIAYYVGKTGSIDLTSAADIVAMLTASYTGLPHLTVTSNQALATVIADSNEAIESHASAAVSLADTLSYTLAAETVAQESATAALQAAVAAAGSSVADLTAVTGAFTGASLATAIDAARAGSAQATGFVAAGPLATSAASVDFTIGFGTPVTGLTAADFKTVAGGGLIGTRVTGLAPVAGSDGRDYDVTVATGAGSGSLAVGFDPNASLLAGSFSPASNALLEPARPVIDAGGAGYGLTVGDLNGDGRPDAVLVSDDGNDENQLTVLLNQGDGSFAAAAPINSSVGGNATNSQEAVAIGDFNGDGKPDLLAVEGSPVAGQIQVAVLPGNGDGTFATPIITATADRMPDGAGEYAFTKGVAVGDFNHDGRLDIAIAGAGSSSGYYGSTSGDTVNILLGNGDGTFRAGQGLDTQTFSGDNDAVTAVATADLNNDGNLDIAALNYDHDTVDLYLGNGDGTFRAAPSLTFPTGANSPGDDGVAMAIGDVNGDGIPDIVVLDNSDYGADPVPGDQGSVAVFLGKGDGTFTSLAPFNLHSVGDYSIGADSIALADLNGDGRLDLVVNGSSGTEVLDGDGDGAFTLSYATSDGASGSEDPNGGEAQLAVADVNGDGRPDVLVAGPADAETDEVGAQVGLNVLLNASQTVLGSTSQAIAVDRPSLAVPALSETSGGGTFTHVGDAYTLDLGTLAFGAATTAVFSLANTAAAPADSFDGTFSTPTGSGFTVAGASLPQPVAAGGSYAGLTFTANAGAPGAYSETITFAPRDATAIPAVVTTPDPNGGDAASPAAASVANPVAAELPAITLTVTADVMPCFHAGTRIATPAGAVAVETLRVGDLVSTASGGARPVVWIGSRRVDCTRHPRPDLVHPVRVAAGAFGPRLPTRDLLLSPDHAVFANGVLIPVKRLVNGATVAVDPRASVEYFHIELDRHDIVLAEGLPTESYLDTGDRGRFSGGALVALHPDFSTRVWEAEGCAPLKIVGPEVDRVRDTLVRRAKRARAKERAATRTPVAQLSTARIVAAASKRMART